MREIEILGMLSVMSLLFAMSTAIADPGKGTGVVRIYSDSGYVNELTPDGTDHYLLGVGVTYYFEITDISEYASGTQLMIKIGYKIHDDVDPTVMKPATDFLGPYPLSDGTVQFSWTVPANAWICETGTVHYYSGTGEQYLAQNPFKPIPSVFHVVPENYLGPLGALGAGALALVAFATFKRRTIRLPYIKFK